MVLYIYRILIIINFSKMEGNQICPGSCMPRKSTLEKIFTKINAECDQNPSRTDQKITIVGAGAVGMACAVAILYQRISNEIVLVDIDEKLIKGEEMDLIHGSPMLDFRVEACSDYKKCEGSKIVIITAGVKPQEGESRLAIIDKNVEVFQDIIPNIQSNCPDAILVIVSNPCDVLTYVAWKLSGFPRHRIIGTGTVLDSARFRYSISERLGVSPKMVDAWIIGEHGDNSVALWSGVSVGNVRLRDIEPKFGRDDDPENWQQVHKDVIDAGAKVQSLKGNTNWGIGAVVATIVDSILHDKRKILPVTTFAKCILKIKDDVTLSLPCVLGSCGVVTVLKNTISRDEHEKLKESSEILYKVISEIKYPC